MTTATEHDILTWDSFIERDIPPYLNGKSKEDWTANLRTHIERYRTVDWKQIRHHLVDEHSLLVPEGLEPHWTEPGSAVFWEQEVTTVRVENEPPLKGGEWVEKKGEWVPVGPFPANNAAQIAQRLGKGLRLRPPEHGPGVETLENALPSEEAQAEPAKTMRFHCLRHRQREFHCETWKQYRNHCKHFGEPLEHPFPGGMHRRIKMYEFYCGLHNLGTNTPRTMTQHIRHAHTQRGRVVELSLEDTRVISNRGDKTAA